MELKGIEVEVNVILIDIFKLNVGYIYISVELIEDFIVFDGLFVGVEGELLFGILE